MLYLCSAMLCEILLLHIMQRQCLHTQRAQTHLDFTFFAFWFDCRQLRCSRLSIDQNVCLEVLALERERAGEMVSYEIVAHNCATHYYFIVWFCDDYKTH